MPGRGPTRSPNDDERRLDIDDTKPEDPQSEQSGTLTLDQLNALSSAVAVVAPTLPGADPSNFPASRPLSDPL